MAKKNRINGEMDTKREKEIYYEQTYKFKSTVAKFQDPCYKIIDRPVSLNEGNYKPSFERVDAKIRTPALKEFEKTKPNKRFYNVSPCVLKKHSCSLKSRQEAKVQNPQEFKSSIQLEAAYFEKRNHSNALKPNKKNKFEQKRLNIAAESENLPLKHNSVEKSPSNGDQKTSKKDQDRDATPKNNVQDLGASMSPKAQTPGLEAQNFSVKLKQAQVQSSMSGKMK